MLLPLGFEQQTLTTPLGEMVYATAKGSLWQQTSPSEVKPSLVFLHGFGGGSSSYEWSKVYPAFADDYRILAPDLIGWGRSARSPRNYQIEDYTRCIVDFLEQTCTGPVSVIASSLTAAFVVRIASIRPELFQSMILVAPAGLSDFGQDYTRSFFSQLVSLPLLDRLIYFSGIANELAIGQFLEQRQFAQANRVSRDIVQAYLSSAQQPNAEYSALSFVRGDLSFDLSEYIPALTTPTALIWGDQSQFTTPELGRRFAALNPTAIQQFQILEEVGLTPQLEVPAITAGLIRKFLRLLQA